MPVSQGCAPASQPGLRATKPLSQPARADDGVWGTNHDDVSSLALYFSCLFNAADTAAAADDDDDDDDDDSDTLFPYFVWLR